MKVLITAEELINIGLWDRFCDKRGINVWAINEGLMDEDEKFVLSWDEAEELGIIKDCYCF